jgi:hypothetical protein
VRRDERNAQAKIRDAECAAGVTRKAFIGLAAGALSATAMGGRASAQSKEQPVGEGKMQRRKIPSSGEEMPVIGLGTWQGFDVGEGADERAPLAGVLDTLFESGGSVIDSSPMYGAAEGVVGDLLAQMKTPREKPFVATKVWIRGREAGIAQMRQSMKLLRVSRLDLMQVHNLVDWRTHLATLRKSSTSSSSITRSTIVPPKSGSCRSRPSAASPCSSTGPSAVAVFCAVYGTVPCRPLPARSAARAGDNSC